MNVTKIEVFPISQDDVKVFGYLIFLFMYKL